MRRREDSSEHNSDLKVSSSQDSRRSENEYNFEGQKPAPKPLSIEYTPPFLFPKYNENYTAETKVNVSNIVVPAFTKIIINVPDTDKQSEQNEVDFTSRQTSSKINVNHNPKHTLKSNIIEGRILNRPGTPQSSLNSISDGFKSTTAVGSSTTSNDLVPVVTSNDVPVPASGLLPPFDTISVYDDSTTQGPPIYYEWKIPASGLEPPNVEEIKSKESTAEVNQIPVLPPPVSSKPAINIPILEKELVPPIYDTNRLTFTKIRVPSIGLEPPKLLPPIVSNETTQNHTFPSLAPLSAAFHNFSSTHSDKSQTPRSVSTTETVSNDVSSKDSPTTSKDNNYLDLQKMFLIPAYTFPLETDQRPGYEQDNAVNSFQNKYPDAANSGSHWYGENADCPECHPSFLKPGTCEPCIKLR